MAMRPFTGWGERGGGFPSAQDLREQDYRPPRPPVGGMNEMRPSPMMGGPSSAMQPMDESGMNQAVGAWRQAQGSPMSTAAPVPMPNRQSLQRDALMRLLQGGM